MGTGEGGAAGNMIVSIHRATGVKDVEPNIPQYLLASFKAILTGSEFLN
jgi:hypothetical protein